MQELTFALLRLRSLNSEWWDFMKPYWDSLPKDGEVLREQSFSDDLLALLQDKALVMCCLLPAHPAKSPITPRNLPLWEQHW